MYRIRPLSAVGTDSSAATRAALIEAAAPLFASVGFEAARTRDIADKAKANVSAINYHFGSKMGLYQAVIKAQAEEMIASFPLETEAVRGEDPATRLHWLVHNLMRRVVCTNEDHRLRICVREFVEQTEALDFLVKEIVSHQFSIMKSVVTAVLGYEPSEEELNRFTVSVVCQCFHYGMAEPMLTRLGVKVPSTEEEINTLSEHIVRFSLAGLQASRRADA
ncbi:MAG TPA: CerR family C-terminal domain-containing protein [Moraxellaceae bacterium]